MSDNKKATFYLDQADEITNVISQVQDAPQKIIALVLPKRAPTFQSIVNLKLLKRAAAKSQKRVVLITNDKSITTLAGATKMHVAVTPQSRPFIPDAPEYENADPHETEVIDPSKTIGELEENSKKTTEKDDLDDTELPTSISLDESDAKKKKKKKGPKIPDFNKFRLRIFIGVAVVIALIVGWLYATRVLPRADIIIETATQSSAQTIEFRATLEQESVDTDSFTAPLVLESYNATETAQATTTGEKNVGERASGSVDLTNCTSMSNGFTVPEGTVLESGSFQFVTMEAVELPPTTIVGPLCRTDAVTVSVQATEPGQQYNLSSRSYTIADYPEVLAEGSEMSGGTDDIVRVVNERDIRTAAESAELDLLPSARAELEDVHRFEGRQPLPDTLEVAERNQRASPSDGSEADEVSVSLEAEFTMLGINNDDIVQLLEAHMSDEVNFDRQSIIDDGLDSASIRISNRDDSGVTVSIRTIVAVGAEIDEGELIESLQGTKRSEAESLILAIEGVRDVQIDFSPFWVASTPDNPEKVTIEIVQQGSATTDVQEQPEGTGQDEE